MTEAPSEAKRSLDQRLGDLQWMMGHYTGRMEAYKDSWHTCKDSHLRYPWPPDKNCEACRRSVERHVKKNHLEMPYRLFGWDVIVYSLFLAINRKIEQAEARRNRGAYI